GFAGHDAVGVQHDHVPVALAPPSQEVGDVAALLVNGDPPLAVKYPAEAIQLFAELGPRDLFLDPAIWVVGVAENEEIEPLEPARLLQRTENHAQYLDD